MAKIYVSSTYLDLQDYRAQVERVIRRMGHEDVAMEYYVAEDQRPVDRCLSDVAACDLYIGVFAWRYGWIPKKNNRKKLSITEMEYRQAEKTGKPCLIFLLDGKAPWPPDFIDDDKTQIKRLRNELSEKHGTGPGFKSVDELGRLVAEAIHKWEKEHGYIPVATTIPEYDLTAYFTALRKRYTVLALEGLTPPQKEEYLQIQLRSVFVEQNVRESPPPAELPKEVWEKMQRDRDIHPEDLPSGMEFDEVRRMREVYFEKPARPVLDVLTDARHQQAIILGDPGSGKSTLARYIMLSLIDASGDEKLRRAFDGYLPLLIELRTYTGACLEGNCATFLEFLEYLGKTESWHLTQAALHNHLKNDGRAVVIFDGLDEIFDPDKREQITRQIVGFANDYPKARIIVTSRVIGYRRKILTDAGFTHFTLQDLDEKQVETFVDRWYDLALSDRPDEAKERKERILKSFKDSPSIRQLAGNPMLLTIMAIIGKHQELPRERWKLYDHAASVLIQHWDVNKHLKDQRVEADFIGEDDKKELLRRLAFKMQGAEGGLAGNYIHRDELQTEFENYLIERYSQTPDRAKVIAEMMIQQFRERNFILSLYGANLYGFVHRAFLEYFCASSFVYKFEKTKELTIEQLKTEVYGKHWEDQSWHEVLRLICGMIDEKWAGRMVDFLLDYDTKLNTSGFPPLLIAFECLNEIRNRKTILKTVRRFVDRLILFIDKVMLHETEIGSFFLDVGKFGGEKIAEAANGLEEIHLIVLKYSKNQNMNRRLLVPYALAIGWPESPHTITILKSLAINDKNALVRAVALTTLIEYFHEDSQVLILATECAVKDESANVRSAALAAVARKYRDNAQTFPLLYERLFNDIDGQVRASAIEAIAQYFNKDAQVMQLLLTSLNDIAGEVRSSAIHALGEYFHEEIQILSVLCDRAVSDTDGEARSSAVYALAEYFRDNAQILQLLRDRAVNDSEARVRSSAVYAIAEYFQDDAQTLLLLRDRVVNDSDGAVRSSAVRALGQYFRHDVQTLPLLHDCAINDSTEEVRYSAVLVFMRYFRDSSASLLLFRNRALNDSAAKVRSIAIDAIVQYYRNDAQTLSLLHNRAVNDESPKPDDIIDPLESWPQYVREIAINGIAKYWPDHPDTIPLLEDRAKNDPTPWLRERAKELLEELSKRKQKMA